MAIFITGDMHGYISEITYVIEYISNKSVDYYHPNYLIVAGDFGFIFQNTHSEKMFINDLENYCVNHNMYILFVDGNHENFDVINALPVERFLSGNAHKINNHIFHLMRGEVFYFTEENAGVEFSILAFGGARSVDKAERLSMEKQDGIKRWWMQEIPTSSDVDNLIKNIGKVKGEIDFIVTHQAPPAALRELERMEKTLLHSEDDALLLETLNLIDMNVKYKQWFFGHHHIDKSLGRYTACLKDIHNLGEYSGGFSFGELF